MLTLLTTALPLTQVWLCHITVCLHRSSLVALLRPRPECTDTPFKVAAWSWSSFQAPTFTISQLESPEIAKPTNVSQVDVHSHRQTSSRMSVQYITDCSTQAARYFFNLLRRIQIARFNNQIASDGRKSLMALPDDLLWLILDYTRQSDLDGSSNGHRCQDLVHLSMCSQRMRALASPFLFRKIHLGPSWSPARMVETLGLLRVTETALQTVVHLEIDIWPEPSQMVGAELLGQLGSGLVDCMSRMSRLNSVFVSATVCCSETMQKAFEDAGRKFPQIITLTTGSHLGWMAPYCPNLETLSSNDWLIDPTCGIDATASFIQFAGKASSLYSFTCIASWDLEKINQIYEAMPQLHRLGLLGRICPTFDELLKLLRNFRNLRILMLPDVSMLNDLGTPDRDHGPSFESNVSLAHRAVITMIFDRLPGLREIHFGRHFQAWKTIKACQISRLSIAWETTPTYGQLQGRTNKLQHRHWQDETWSQDNVDDDEMEAVLSAAEDSASIFSHADTLTLS